MNYQQRDIKKAAEEVIKAIAKYESRKAHYDSLFACYAAIGETYKESPRETTQRVQDIDAFALNVFHAVEALRWLDAAMGARMDGLRKERGVPDLKDLTYVGHRRMKP